MFHNSLSALKLLLRTQDR